MMVISEILITQRQVPMFQGTCTTVYALYFTYKYFRDFGIGWEIRKGLILRILLCFYYYK